MTLAQALKNAVYKTRTGKPKWPRQPNGRPGTRREVTEYDNRRA